MATGDTLVVLVAEDEWLLRDVIAAHFRSLKCHVLEVRTGEAAVALLQAGERIDIVFTDVGLAGKLTGWDVGARFRQVNPRMPIVYATGEPERPELVDPRSLFLPKPYDPRAAVQTCLTLAHWTA